MSSTEESICIICDEKFQTLEAHDHVCFNGIEPDDLFACGDYVGPNDEIDAFMQEVNPQYLEDESIDEEGMPSIIKKRKLNDKLDLDFGDNVENVELNKTGNAKKCPENYITLVELVKEHPILWNHKLPIEQRNPLAKSKEWNKILQNFPGWSKEFITKKFQSLKDVYLKRQVSAPSGSAQRAQKYWIFDESFSFLKDITQPAPTISNIQQLKKPNQSNANDNTESALKELGFNSGGKALVIAGSRKKSTPFDEQILKCIDNLTSPKHEQAIDSYEQFGLSIGKEIGKLPSSYERLDVQIKMLQVLRNAVGCNVEILP